MEGVRLRDGGRLERKGGRDVVDVKITNFRLDNQHSTMSYRVSQNSVTCESRSNVSLLADWPKEYFWLAASNSVQKHDVFDRCPFFNESKMNN